jgi:hypothetical protein
MPSSKIPRDANCTEEISDPGDEASLEEVLKTVPKGALTLAGIALGVLLLAWLALYFLIFLPRGPIS